MSRPIYAVVHQAALAHNLAIARQYMPESEVFAVIKANAYGHGIERVYDAFKSADGFAVLEITEARRLRALGWQGKILLLEGIFSPQDLYDCTALNLSFSLHSDDQLEWLQAFSHLQQSPDSSALFSEQIPKFDVFLKMNSGMNRLGFTPDRYTEVWHQLKQLDVVDQITHMTHFSDADGERFGQSGIAEQLQCFESVIAELPGKRSISNSAAILGYAQQLHSDVVRSGIMLYGSSPDYPNHTIQDWNLQPTQSLRSTLIAIQYIQAGQSVGYGSRFVAEHSMRIGIVACGYADGYQRLTETGTPVLVNSVRTQIIGRVSMDMLAVDLSTISDANVGSEVVLWGVSSQGAVLPIDEVAAGSGTVGYELICALTARVAIMIEHEFKQ